jgi:NAD(P)-dependent dehydrogenase (short-subunit alcohol dehydrogenase family)
MICWVCSELGGLLFTAVNSVGGQHRTFQKQGAMGMQEQNRTWIIMTGASRGIGLAMAKQFRARGLSVCALLRPQSIAASQPHVDRIIAWDCDQPWHLNPAQDLLDFAEKEKVVGFVHAAGLLGPMERPPAARESSAWQLWWDEYRSTLRVNHLSGMELALGLKTFLKPWKNQAPSERPPFLMHVSSGAAVKPYVGWGAYCSSKAAMLMDFKCLASQFDCREILVLSVAPGTVMTDMMRQVLASQPEDFPAIDKFKELEKSGGLVPPDLAGEKMVRWLVEQPAENLAQWHGQLYDVRNNN